jgi:hypothetical protein
MRIVQHFGESSMRSWAALAFSIAAISVDAPAEAVAMFGA